MAVEASNQVKFHMSLNVSDLDRSIAFYRILFGIEPAKQRADYAKFEPAEPPLVLSLEPMPRNAGGSLNHVGLRVRDAKELVAFQSRLEAAGITTDREEGVECCYSKQTKFWVSDPDRVLWELYVLEEDIDHCGDGQSREVVQKAYDRIEKVEPAEKPWEHRLGDEIPLRIDLPDNSVSEVRLSGTMNADLPLDALTRLRWEALRILAPGGILAIHGLVADKPFPSTFPKLPGPASVVKKIPLESDVLGWLEEAGLESIQITKLSPAPIFQHDGVEMRELRVNARKPADRTGYKLAVMYKGPFKELVDDAGNRFPRGRRAAVDQATAKALESPALADSFVVMPAVETVNIRLGK